MEEHEGAAANYEEDVYGWSQRQAALLRAGRYDEIDVENVVEEIESVGRSQVASLASCYRLITAHLLKVLFQPERFTRSWQGTIVRERFNIIAYLKDSPSLKPRQAEVFSDVYVQACRLASADTGLPMRSFPTAAPFTWEQAASENYQPWAALIEPDPSDR